MGLVLDRYKGERERGQDHYDAHSVCAHFMIGCIKAMTDSEDLKRTQELLHKKPDYKKIVTDIEAMIKEYNTLDCYENVDVTQIKNDPQPASKESHL